MHPTGVNVVAVRAYAQCQTHLPFQRLKTSDSPSQPPLQEVLAM